MKKILLSLAMVVFVGAAAAGATGAFFSDNETSTGNTFTAGAIDLKVDSQSHYNHMVCTQAQVANIYTWQPEVGFTPDANQYPAVGSACDGTWSLTDLGPTNKFFNFGDVKPGDQGEDTVSLHLDTNPAWACAYIKTTSNLENTYTQPEVNAGDVSTTSGELAQNIHLFAWLDNASTSGAIAGDNIWQAGETVLQAPVAMSAIGVTTTLALADPSINGGAPLAGGSTSFVGIGWCAGTLVVSSPGSWSCSGAAMDNQAQTDSATANVIFHVEQSRNNAAFRCNAPIVVGANDLETTLANAATSAKWYFYDDTADVLNNTLGTFAIGPSTPPLGTGSALVNPLLVASGRTVLANSQFGGTLLSSISAMSFAEYTPSGAWSTSEAPFTRFNVDFTGSAAYQKSLVYVPSANGAVTQNTWQAQDMINAGNAMWCWSGMTGCGGSGASWPAQTGVLFSNPSAPLQKWSDIVAAYPGIKMHPLFPFIGMRVGEPGPLGLTANIDNFSITISGTTKTYDFGN